MRDAVRQEIQQSVGPMLQPMMQQTHATQVAQARQIASSQIPDFASLEGDVMERISNMPPESLQNPEMWIHAADLVRGQRMRTGQQPQAFQQQQVQQQPQAARFVPAQQASYMGFTENPTPPAVDQLGGGSLSQAEVNVAKSMGMSSQEYMMWKGGVTAR